MGGCGGGEGGGEGEWGEALIEVLNKTGIVTFSLVIIMHFTRRNRPKSRGIPNFWGNPHCNDITFSRIHHNLAQKNENARDFSREEEGVMAAMGSLKAFQTQILKQLDYDSA